MITISRSSSVCRSPTPCSRCRSPATIWPTMRARLRSSPRRHRHQLRCGRHPRAKGDALSLNGLRVDEAIDKGERMAGRGWCRQGHGQLPSARLAVQPPALLGRAVPRSSTAKMAPRICCRTTSCRSTCRTCRTGPRLSIRKTPNPISKALSRNEDWVRSKPTWRRQEDLSSRHQHHAELGRILLVLHALPRPDRHRTHGGEPAAEVVEARPTPTESRPSYGTESTRQPRVWQDGQNTKEHHHAGRHVCELRRGHLPPV